MNGQRLDGALRQDRTEAEREVGGIPHFLHGDRQRAGQALPAIIRRRGEAAPAAFHPLPVGVRKTFRGLHALALFEPRAFLVARPVQRGQHIGGELCAFFQHRLHEVGAQFGKIPLAGKLRQARHIVQNEGHVTNGRTIGHGGRLLKSRWINKTGKPHGGPGQFYVLSGRIVTLRHAAACRFRGGRYGEIALCEAQYDDCL